ncbi:hypothetical protein U1Q18_004718 [Sarracenia purpurea var. burkii]
MNGDGGKKKKQEKAWRIATIVWNGQPDVHLEDVAVIFGLLKQFDGTLMHHVGFICESPSSLHPSNAFEWGARAGVLGKANDWLILMGWLSYWLEASLESGGWKQIAGFCCFST